MKINQQNYVDEAERVIKTLRGRRVIDKRTQRSKPIAQITTSKIRGLLSMTADIYNDVSNCKDEQLPSAINDRIEYLRIRFVYESGREPSVKYFVEEANLLDIHKGINGKKSNYILFSRYMEALVAFHKFYDGKDE